MIIDFHAHAFPEKLAARALGRLTEKSGGLKPQFDGTVDGLLGLIARHGIDRAVVLNIATNAEQQAAVNNFTIEINNGAYAGGAYADHSDGGLNPLIAFGSVYPFEPSAFAELDRLHAAGVKGIKFHPEYQRFFVDDERMFPVYEKIASLGMITVFHAGADIGQPRPVHGTPERFARALPHFLGAPVVAAHFGGYIQWEAAEKHLVGTDIYFDTSYCYTRIPLEVAACMVRAHGVQKVLFGTDSPWTDVAGEIGFVRALGLSAEEEEQIFSGNARRLLKIG